MTDSCLFKTLESLQLVLVNFAVVLAQLCSTKQSLYQASFIVYEHDLSHCRALKKNFCVPFAIEQKMKMFIHFLLLALHVMLLE